MEYTLGMDAGFNEGKATRAKLLKHLKTGSIEYWYLWTSSRGSKHIVGKIHKGGTTMTEIHFPEITLEYIKDILVPNPKTE